MDRPILLTNLYNVATPLVGVKVVEAADPATLTERCQAIIDAAAGAGYASAYLQGFELAGGGAGDSCRAILTLTRNLGWGLLTSPPAGLARVMFRRASHSREITTVLEQMYAAIADGATYSPFIWQPRIVGTGRDGSYLIGLCWSDGNPGHVVLNTEAFAEAGPFTEPTTILSLTVPRTVDGTVDTETSWLVSWGMIVNDTTSSGAGIRLDMNAVPLWETYEAGAAAEWQDGSAQYNHIQDDAALTTFDLVVVNTGVNAVSVRGAYLRAELAGYPNSPS